MGATAVTEELSAPALAGAAIDASRDAAPIATIATIAEALEAALRTRAPAHHAGTPLVRKLAAKVSGQLGLDADERLAVDVCAQVRDVGMIALPDSVVLKTGPLSPEDSALLGRHPELGAELLQSFPVMGEIAELVRAHHERWDGTGSPDGLRAEAIPTASRIVAVCDAFVSLATDRPHRRGIGAEGAMKYILAERKAQFDPEAVDCLLAALTGKASCRQRALVDGGDGSGSPAHATRQTPARARELRGAMAEFDAIPAFGPAIERTLSAAAFGGPLGGDELASAVESDIGITVAVLRAAQPRSSVPLASVPKAVALLSGEEIHDAVTALPTMAFPWQTRFEALLLRCGAHAQAVARATDRIAQMLMPSDRDELVAAALLHDLGKLLLAMVWPDFAVPPAVLATPEEALHQERREFGFDHASLGGLLLERWGLPSELAKTVSAHHSARAARDRGTVIRLADMAVHHAQGDAVDRKLMLRLAGACDLPLGSLRAAVVDLRHAGVLPRRRVDGSPLSSRETAIVRLLAGGMRSAAIADELCLTESTVRTHLHNICAKLGVGDRTQAVLRATEMAWI